LRPTKRDVLELPYLVREGDLNVLDLPAKRKMDFKRCADPIYDQVRQSQSAFYVHLIHVESSLLDLKTRGYSGQVRMFFSSRKIPHHKLIADDGQPLLFYSQTGRSPAICRAIFVIDARVVVPGLKDAMDKAGYSAPIRFTQQTGGQTPFLLKDLFPSYSLYRPNQRISN
jgi:hypothetical protein